MDSKLKNLLEIKNEGNIKVIETENIWWLIRHKCKNNKKKVIFEGIYKYDIESPLLSKDKILSYSFNNKENIKNLKKPMLLDKDLLLKLENETSDYKFLNYDNYSNTYNILNKKDNKLHVIYLDMEYSKMFGLYNCEKLKNANKKQHKKFIESDGKNSWFMKNPTPYNRTIYFYKIDNEVCEYSDYDVIVKFINPKIHKKTIKKNYKVLEDSKDILVSMSAHNFLELNNSIISDIKENNGIIEISIIST